ncbi:hypothetical protein E2C01_060777 [Portunus trituberculatus]|uniref:Uncharacterized protein n=1 Tax=Portunus trituberculatus TaxID=210409 RepID=A0A5B7HBI1_PORTR|nr:hypothetical protein [Portunus trituberculatus]
MRKTWATKNKKKQLEQNEHQDEKEKNNNNNNNNNTTNYYTTPPSLPTYLPTHWSTNPPSHPLPLSYPNTAYHHLHLPTPKTGGDRGRSIDPPPSPPFGKHAASQKHSVTQRAFLTFAYTCLPSPEIANAGNLNSSCSMLRCYDVQSLSPPHNPAQASRSTHRDI